MLILSAESLKEPAHGPIEENHHFLRRDGVSAYAHHVAASAGHAPADH
jgi:hypothetical protein